MLEDELAPAQVLIGSLVPGHSFEYGLKVLEDALAIGRQADALGVDEVRTRLEKVQSRASKSTSLADSPSFSKVKSWFERKKQIQSV